MASVTRGVELLSAVPPRVAVVDETVLQVRDSSAEEAQVAAGRGGGAGRGRPRGAHRGDRVDAHAPREGELTQRT